jgi:carbon-monoxide dehydrogenase medium subunit
MPGVLALLSGSIEAVSIRGTRTIHAAEFFTGPLECALAADELAISATFPNPGNQTGTAWVELARRHGDYALVGVGAVVHVEDSVIRSAKLALIGVDATPVVLDLQEVLPQAGDDPAWSAAVEYVRASIKPEADIHATAEYRQHVAGVLAQRALDFARADIDERVAA